MRIHEMLGAPASLQLRELASEASRICRQSVVSARFGFVMNKPRFRDVKVPQARRVKPKTEIDIVERNRESFLVESPNSNKPVSPDDHHSGSYCGHLP